MTSPLAVKDCDRIARCLSLLDRRAVAATSPLRAAAVCIVLVTALQRMGVLIVHRASGLRSHAGQWALPGGKLDFNETAVQAALRELREETGLSATEEDVLGVLDDFVTRSGYLITPIVVCAGHSVNDLVLDPAEIQGAFTIALDDLMREETFEWFRVGSDEDNALRICVGDDYLYAPAAALIYQFRELLLGRATRVMGIEQPDFAWR